MEEKRFAGIDVSKQKLDIAIYEGKIKTFENSEEGIASLIGWIKEQRISPKVVVESTGSYHWLCCLMLCDEEIDVRLINPLITKKYQKSSIRDAKSDSVDAMRLAEISRLEKELPPFFDTRETLKNKRYQSLLAKLETTKQQLKRSYDSALEAAGVIDIEMDLSCIKDALDAMESAIKTLKRMIENSAEDLAKKVAEIKGVSLFQATVLCQAVSGRTFKNRDQLTAFFGLDVRARQSGNWSGGSHLSKRGNAFYRKVLFQMGWSLWRNNPLYQEYYERLKNNGKHYYTILIAIARKFLRYFFSNFLAPSL